jgi:hypothetical protein
MTANPEDHKAWFQRMYTVAPSVTIYDPEQGIGTSFWEDMYQAFKSRYEEETNDRQP